MNVSSIRNIINLQRNLFRKLLILSASILAFSCNDPIETVSEPEPLIEVSPSASQATDSADERSSAIAGKAIQKPRQVTVSEPAADKPKPALKLSIENIEDAIETGDIGNDLDHVIELDADSHASMLIRRQDDDGIRLSGKLYTDQEMIDSGDYLQSVDGIQLNIEGNFR